MGQKFLNNFKIDKRKVKILPVEKEDMKRFYFVGTQGREKPPREVRNLKSNE